MAVTVLLRSSPANEDVSEAEIPSITFDQPRVVLGRGEGCDLRIPDLSVSHRHASIRQRGTDYIVLDEGSTNGTFIGSVRLHPQSPRVVRNGEMIRLGRVWLEVQVEYAPPTLHTPQATREMALALVCQALDAQGEPARAELRVVAGPDEGRLLVLTGSACVLGRGKNVDFPLDVDDASRRHARVKLQGDQLLLRDLGSRNGTLVEDEPIPADRDTSLRPGDQFQIGPDVFEYSHPAVEALRELEQAEDEPLDPREKMPQPASTVPAEPEKPPAEPDEEPQAEPARDKPQRPPRRATPQASKGVGWGKTDVVIVLLALAVLTLSIVGLFWLFRS